MRASFYVVVLSLTVVANTLDVNADDAVPLTPALTRELSLRSIGPANTPGRIGDIAVDPRNRSTWYVAVASGGVWKTTNRGLDWKPIFDEYGSYSIGCVACDPATPDVVYVGTGENQSQRSVSFGDGVYKSTDGGATFKRVGLEKSEHIARILVDPRNPKVVYAAAQGPLWAPGGDRGLYKSTDAGESWQPVLQISENTGISDLDFDPRNPDVLYATAFQRRRHVGVLVGGGPEGGIFRSEDAGKSWKKLTTGLPDVDLGRIAIAVSPSRPDVVYALVTAAKGKGGFFKSEDRGETWKRQNQYVNSVPEYYCRIFADPHQFDRVYSVDARMSVTNDGGKTFQALNWRTHGDHHALVFDPADPLHLINGNDGGVNESYDGGKTWRHFNNIPTIQFYRIGTDNALPFYNVYGGGQDIGSHAGPSRSINQLGVGLGDWYRIAGGDGFQARGDPKDPATCYALSQMAGITRVDRRTGASKGIKPRVQGENLRWNWDAPFVISAHDHKRLYLAGNRLFRSDDRGDNWKPVSPDLTRNIDRNTLPLMGKVWDADAVDKNRSTTDYGVCSALDESALDENLIYFGTDDCLIQITEDAGKSWRKIDAFPGVPADAYVSDVCASPHDKNVVFASFNNYQRGDFKPYALRSDDRGANWTSIAGDLPDRNPVWSIVQDPVNKDLLFVGTEYALFFTTDAGRHWVQIKSGAPTICFRDLAIHDREADLVAGTFGRGIYILDDITPLRGLTADAMSKDATLLPARRQYVFEELTTIRATEGANEGAYVAPNPPFGAALTYYLRDDLSKQNGKVTLAITDDAGKPVRKLNGPSTPGLHRVTWDLRAEAPPTTRPTTQGRRGGRGGRGARPPATTQAATQNASATRNADDPNAENELDPDAPPQGRRGGFGRAAAKLMTPGKYKVVLQHVADGKTMTIGEPQTVELVPLPRPDTASN